MSYLIYLRIVGYVTVIFLQTGNALYMVRSARGEVVKDPDVFNFVNLQYRYFTCWTFLGQILYSIVGLTCDVLTIRNTEKRGYRLPKHLRGFRDTFFSAFVFPSTMLVFILFWSIFNYDRDLVLPEYMDKILTRVSNHIIHTTIVPLALWEVIFQPRQLPKSHKTNLLLSTFYFLLYMIVIHYTYYERGIWLYPLFKHIYGTIYYPLLIAAIGLTNNCCYWLQWPITKFIWGSTTKVKNKKVR